MNWTGRPVTELQQAQGLQADILRLACVSAGVSPPAGEPQHLLELGCGHGLSLNVHAAANTGTFWGASLTAGQESDASALSSVSGPGAKVLGGSLAELAARLDLPQFDVIALPGLWNSISVQDRRTIVDLIRRNLRVGGLVYVSYSCFPGRASAEPLRHLMTLHSEFAGSGSAGAAEKAEGAVDFVKSMADGGALLFKANPALVERLGKITGQDARSLIDQYLCRRGDLVAFSEVARSFGEAKLAFAASANLLDHLDGMVLSPEGARLLAGIPHPILRQSVRDYLVDQQFRRDVFVKGMRRLTPLERGEALMAQSFVLISPPADVPLKVQGPQDESTLPEHTCRPLIEVLAENHHEPKSLGRLVGHARLKAIPHAHVVEAVLALTGLGHVSTARVPTAASLTRSRAFNQEACRRWQSAGDTAFLASPVAGSGIPVGGPEPLFLLGLGQGKSTPRELAAHAWEMLAARGKRIVEKGEAIEAAEQRDIAELVGLASLFIDKRLPILKALQIL